MLHYFLSKSPREEDGKFVVHTERCELLPVPEERIDLSNWVNCKDALNMGNKWRPGLVNGCPMCTFECFER